MFRKDWNEMVGARKESRKLAKHPLKESRLAMRMAWAKVEAMGVVKSG